MMQFTILAVPQIQEQAVGLSKKTIPRDDLHRPTLSSDWDPCVLSHCPS